MKKQAFFGLVFGSWILGIFLICIFPPVPDYVPADHQSSYFSQDTVPEFHLRSASQAQSFQLNLGDRVLSIPFEFQFSFSPTPFGARVSEPVIDQIPSFFDTRILFEVYFETT